MGGGRKTRRTKPAVVVVPTVYHDTAELKASLGDFVADLKIDIERYFLACEEHENSAKTTPAPVFNSNRKTSTMKIGPTVVLGNALSKLVLKGWTFYVHTRQRADGNHDLWLHYMYAPGCGGVYQTLPVHIVF
jgi:hypothetical protein